MSNLDIKTADFDALVLKSSKPVLVDFYADWCGPCKMLAPTIEKLATEVADNASVYKVNTDDNQPLAEKYDINTIPTVIVFKNGDEVARHVGAQNITQLKHMLGL